MLRASVNLNRKITRDYNSTGYGVSVEGEILAPPDDAEAVLTRIQELFHLAEEALGQEIDRDQGELALGRHDEERPNPEPRTQDGNHSGRSPRNSTPADGTAPRQGPDEGASNKQVQFLLNLGKRFKLSTTQLEGRIADIIGRRCGVYELTKKEAGHILDQLTKSAQGNGKGEQGS
jgi:hypothetical protein